MKKIPTKANGLIIFDFNRTIFDPEKSKLIPGALITLKKLKKLGYSLCLLSQAVPTRSALIKKLGIEEFFTGIILTSSKNSTLFKRIIAKEKQKNIYVVGDRIKKEITIGNHIGAQTIWLQSGKFSTEMPEKEIEKPKYIIKEIKELLKIIR